MTAMLMALVLSILGSIVITALVIGVCAWHDWTEGKGST